MPGLRFGHFDLIGDYLSERVRPPEFGQDQFDEVLIRLRIFFDHGTQVRLRATTHSGLSPSFRARQ
jgi:hypothetical protein